MITSLQLKGLHLLCSDRKSILDFGNFTYQGNICVSNIVDKCGTTIALVDVNDTFLVISKNTIYRKDLYAIGTTIYISYKGNAFYLQGKISRVIL